MTSPIPWDLYRSFLAVLRQGSLSAASRALGLAQPTVGRHIAALEQALGLVLFTRSQSGLLPTESALALRVHAEVMESTAAAIERAAQSEGDGVRGVIRVTASEVIGVEVLPQIVAALRERHPHLTIELLLSNQVQDLLHREADIAVRMTRPEQGQLVARYVGRIELGLHASNDYVSRHGLPTNPSELTAHTVIGFDRITPFIRNALAALPELGRDTFAIRCDSDLAQLALIRIGAGIGFCQIPIAKRGTPLVRVLPDRFSLHLDTWVTMHEDQRNRPCCRIVFDALVEGMQRHIGITTNSETSAR